MIADSTLNPAAEAFRNFDADPPPGLTSSFSLDNDEDRRRGAASRANSVRFDESANNHYGSTPRQSIDLPTRTGSGLGSHPLSERSLSHRSDGRGSSIGLSHRTNSFGLEGSRLLGSINNSPRVSGNPPPGFFVLGPCPSIIRCWLTETFSNDSLLYAAVCTGSYASSIGRSLVHHLGLSDQVTNENGIQKIKLPVYLTEAKIHQASSRSASPAPQVPTLTAKFVVLESQAHDRSIQIILGSDVLRAHNADVLLSQDKLMIFDEERNQLAVPLVRPENDAVYKQLTISSVDTRVGTSPPSTAPQSMTDEQRPPGIIGRPARLITQEAASPMTNSPIALTSAVPSETLDSGKPDSETMEGTPRSSTDLGMTRQTDDAKSATGSEKSFQTPTPKSGSGVWGSSWRASSGTSQADASLASKNASGYSRASAPRNMKVLRPGKSMANARSTSTSTAMPNGDENQVPRPAEASRRASQTSLGDAKAAQSAPTKSNPIGQASAFGWLNSGQLRRTLANGD